MIFEIEKYFIANSSGQRHDSLLPLILLGLNHIAHTIGQPALPQEDRQPECLVIPFALETMATHIQGQGLDCEQVCEGFHHDLSYPLQNQGMHTYIDICQSSKLVVLQIHGGKEFLSTAEQETRDDPSAADDIHDQCFCLLTRYIVAYSGTSDSSRPWFARNCSPEDIASRLSGSFADESASWIARPLLSHSIMPIACHLEILGPLTNLRPMSPYSLIQSRLPIEIMEIVNGRQRIELWEIVPDIESIMAQYVRENRIDPHGQNQVGIDLTSSALPLASMEEITAHSLTGPQQLQQGGMSAFVVSPNTSPDFANIGILSTTKRSLEDHPSISPTMRRNLQQQASSATEDSNLMCKQRVGGPGLEKQCKSILCSVQLCSPSCDPRATNSTSLIDTKFAYRRIASYLCSRRSKKSTISLQNEASSCTFDVNYLHFHDLCYSCFG